MKKLFFLSLLYSQAIIHPLQAQEKNDLLNKPIRKAWILLNTGEDIISGHVRSKSDSTVLFTYRRAELKNLNSKQIREISFRDIDEIHVHRLGSTWKGMGIGAASGALLGMLLAEMTFQPKTVVIGYWGNLPIEQTTTRKDAVQTGAILGTLGGVIIGTIVGAASHKLFVIKGKKERFRDMQERSKMLP